MKITENLRMRKMDRLERMERSTTLEEKNGKYYGSKGIYKKKIISDKLSHRIRIIVVLCVSHCQLMEYHSGKWQVGGISGQLVGVDNETCFTVLLSDLKTGNRYFGVSYWNVPEPECTSLLSKAGSISGPLPRAHFEERPAVHGCSVPCLQSSHESEKVSLITVLSF